MIDPSLIKKDMPVIASDGERIGTVDAVENGDSIKLKRVDSPDGQHHHVPLSAVDRIDEHVHLNQAADAVRSGFMTAAAAVGAAAVGATAAGAATTVGTTTGRADYTPTPVRDTIVTERVRDVDDGKRDANWLPWILGALALLALLFFGLRSCDGEDRTTDAARTTDTEQVEVDADGVAVAGAGENVTLADGRTVQLSRGTMNYDLQRYLASNEDAPRTFTFDKVHFASGSADILAAERADIDRMADLLSAYPNARIRVVGYADARGASGANERLGMNRARAVASALSAKGIAGNRVATATGGESGEAASNSSARGQAENRRTEVVVTAK